MAALTAMIEYSYNVFAGLGVFARTRSTTLMSGFRAKRPRPEKTPRSAKKHTLKFTLHQVPSGRRSLDSIG